MSFGPPEIDLPEGIFWERIQKKLPSKLAGKPIYSMGKLEEMAEAHGFSKKIIALDKSRDSGIGSKDSYVVYASKEDGGLDYIAYSHNAANCNEIILGAPRIIPFKSNKNGNTSRGYFVDCRACDGRIIRITL